MVVVMRTTRLGSEDGHAVRIFETGKSYDIADTLARWFICNGWGTEARLRDAQTLI